jgi:SAM-dependent methyltransferase
MIGRFPQIPAAIFNSAIIHFDNGHVTVGSEMKVTRYHSGATISAEECYPASSCPICGDDTPRAAVVVIQRDPEITLLSCQRCFGLSASHMPTRAALDRFYGSYYEHVEKERVTFYKPIRLARHLASSVKVPQTGDLRILDFGGGDGTISALTASLLAERTGRKVHVQVVDYLQSDPRTDGRVAIEYLTDLGDAEDGADLVIASAVFEHIPDLRTVLPAVAAKMRPGGYLYARTPYMLPFMKMLRVDMTYPGHVHDLGDRFWGTLPSWLAVPVALAKSQPSIVESGLRQSVVATVAAHVLKFPSRVETLWTRHPVSKLYGGWEVLLRRSF